ncbi:uncharacterized protein LOC144144479 [Haemaphysalis longicornis]
MVIVGGYDVGTSTREARDSIGYCPQTGIFFDDLTVEEHLDFFASLKGLPSSKRRVDVVTLLEDIGLTKQRSVLPAELSWAQQRRLSIAIAVLGTPKLVVLDEPTAGVDSDGRRDIWEVLLKIRRRCTIVLTTQNLEEADVLADRVAVITGGRIRCAGSPSFLRRRFGFGYRLSVSKMQTRFGVAAIERLLRKYGPDRCDVPAIERLLRKYAPDALRRSDTTEVVFTLGQTLPSRQIIALFKVRY